jgi:non-specific serine/threonine protein kinase
LHLYDAKQQSAFTLAVNNVVYLAQAIAKVGIFKACLFNARQTLHLSREQQQQPFLPTAQMKIPYEIAAATSQDESSKQHSYFEDGKDPDEQLVLPDAIMADIARLNLIRHSGCIIFEVTALYMKIHSYFHLLDPQAEPEFSALLANILKNVNLISGEGVGGFMKLPHKDTRYFKHQMIQPTLYYPANPLQALN